MRRKKFSVGFGTALAIFTVSLLVASTRASGQEKVLYNFLGGADGNYPLGGVIFDAQGNLYGTTDLGGGGACPGGCGTVFKLTPAKTGSYTKTIIYSFQGPFTDGQNPQARLVFDTEGNLYGTTLLGGSSLADEGTVFKLTPTKSGQWTETILHNFNCATANDGCEPYSYLIFDKAGNLYGTTLQGGGGDNSSYCTNGCGTVFKLSKRKKGMWPETLLYTFPHFFNNTTGANPYAGLVMDAKGSLYGTAYYGGPDASGVVFRLTHAHGVWTETVLHTFSYAGTDGFGPNAGVVLDKSGNLYGTTSRGGIGAPASGVAFMLTPAREGEWMETILHNFPSTRFADGAYPVTGLILDAAGNLYGAASDGGGQDEADCPNNDGCGVVYKLSNSGGTWNETILYAFQGGLDGGFPLDDVLAVDVSGNLYGAAITGGTGGAGAGVVFQVKP
jgi:uncharacterized repeat protein (TIGR03803 family)